MYSINNLTFEGSLDFNFYLPSVVYQYQSYVFFFSHERHPQSCHEMKYVGNKLLSNHISKLRPCLLQTKISIYIVLRIV